MKLKRIFILALVVSLISTMFIGTTASAESDWVYSATPSTVEAWPYEWFELKVKTSDDIYTLYHYSPDDYWYEYEYYESGSYLYWTFWVYFEDAGDHELTFSPNYYVDSHPSAKTVYVHCYDEDDYAVNELYWVDTEYAMVGTPYRMEVWTGAYMDNLYLAMDDGTVVNSWGAKDNSYVDGDQRVWNISHTFTGAGERSLNFYGKMNGEYFSESPYYFTLEVREPDYSMDSVAFDSDVFAKGTKATITAKTGVGAKYLAMYSEDGSKVQTWNAADYSSVSSDGTQRIWKVNYKFGTTGSRKMTFKASYNNKKMSSGKSANVLITSGSSINVTAAAFSKDTATKGTAATIKVTSGADAKYLGMFTENGTLAKTWDAATYSKIVGNDRVWTVKHSFVDAGQRTLTFKASKDNKKYGTGKSATVLVTSGNDINVTSAAFAKDYIVKGNSVSITVKTGLDAKYLAMFTESGGKAKTWKAADNSTISGTTRVWKISYSFSGAGNRTMTFKASKDNKTFGKGKSDSIVITSGNDINVTSAAFAKDYIVKGNSVSITVKTGLDAKYLAMYTEADAKAKTWDAATYSTVSGASRVWKVSYTFSGAGSRKLTFRASKNNSTFGTGKSDTLLITTGSEYSVKSAAFAKDVIGKGKSVSITVKTGADAKYIAMYSEDGTKIKTWSAADYSTISGSSRVWKISYSFGGTGLRELSFKASKDNKTFSKAKSAVILVE